MRLPPLEQACEERVTIWTLEGGCAWTRVVKEFRACEDVPIRTGNVAALTAARRASAGGQVAYATLRPASRIQVVFCDGQFYADAPDYFQRVEKISLALESMRDRI